MTTTVGTGLIALEVAAGGLSAAIGGAVEAAAEAAQIDKIFETVLKNSGAEARGVTKDVFNGITQDIAKALVVDDDDVKKGLTPLLRIPDLSRPAFEELAKVAADAGAATGKGLEQVSQALNKVASDPNSGFGALKALGVVVDDSTKEVVKGMVEQGDSAGALGILIGELKGKYEGAAKAAGEAASPQQALHVALQNTQEQLGALLLPVLKVVTSLFTSLPGPVKLIVVALLALIPVVGILAGVIASVTTILPVLGGALAALTSPITLIVVAVGILAIVIIKNWDTIKRVTIEAFDAVKDKILTVFNFVKDTVTTVVEFLYGLFRRYVNLYITVFRVAFDAISTVVETVFDVIRSIVETSLGAIHDAISTVLGVARAIFETEFHIIQSVVETLGHVFGAVFDGISNAVQVAFGTVRDVVGGVADFIGGIVDRIGGIFGSLADFAWGAVDAVVDAFLSLPHKIGGIISDIKDRFCDLPFVPCSPIPMVEDAKLAVSGVQKALGGLGPGATGNSTAVTVNVKASFGPGTNAQDVMAAMRVIAREQIAGSVNEAVRRSRAAG